VAACLTAPGATADAHAEAWYGGYCVADTGFEGAASGAWGVRPTARPAIRVAPWPESRGYSRAAHAGHNLTARETTVGSPLD